MNEISALIKETPQISFAFPLPCEDKTRGPQDRNKDIENGLEDTGRGKGKLGRSERVALTYIHYQM